MVDADVGGCVISFSVFHHAAVVRSMNFEKNLLFGDVLFCNQLKWELDFEERRVSFMKLFGRQTKPLPHKLK